MPDYTSAEWNILVVRDPAGQYYAFPREEAERWRLSEDQEAEVAASIADAGIADADVTGYDLRAGLPPFVGFGIASTGSPQGATSGLSAGQPQPAPLRLWKRIDKASPLIQQA